MMLEGIPRPVTILGLQFVPDSLVSLSHGAICCQAVGPDGLRVFLYASFREDAHPRTYRAAFKPCLWKSWTIMHILPSQPAELPQPAIVPSLCQGTHRAIRSTTDSSG
jgi:hypothetical protein